MEPVSPAPTTPKPVHLSPFRLFLAGVPQVHHFGQEGLHNVLVIDLLGPNLEDLFDMCGRKFTIKTVCMAAKQMVKILLPCMFTADASCIHSAYGYCLLC